LMLQFQMAPCYSFSVADSQMVWQAELYLAQKEFSWRYFINYLEILLAEKQ
jgi:hypothetical protein